MTPSRGELYYPRNSAALSSRWGFAVFWLLSLMAAWFVLRVVLFIAFRPSPTPAVDALLGFLTGAWRDFVAAFWLSLPLFFWLLILPDRHFRRKWHQRVFWAICLLFWAGEIFLLFVEYFFFEEFRSRFNTVAVDYLQYPKEVFINIWDSYHVGLVLAVCLILALVWVLAARKLFRQMWERPFRPSRRLKWAGSLGLAVWLLPLLITAATLTGVKESPIRLQPPHVSMDRTLNEIANNGDLSFFAAAWTHQLEYGAFYKTLPKDEAFRRVRGLLQESKARFSEGPNSIRRYIAGDPNRPRLNLVIFLEESLGSEFWGSLGRKEATLTPEMDALAAREGLLFTNIYASGNRTVRGMEGVLSSFPPLPGESIVKRALSDNVETIARLLKRDGYATLFLYGGRGIFDGMRSYAVRNGYDRFIEQKHFPHPTFTTIWGVCDEDLFQRTLEECREMSKAGQPFLATVLSVSNHKPYTYPSGRIPEDPEQQQREFAVKYSDYALGQFFKAARQEPFWTNTIFAVVADHGARVYGEQSIPIHSYEIPLLIAGPAVVSGPARIGQLGCSLDVAPTLLGLIRRPYDSTFFGRDLLNSAPEQGRALLNHNRDIGMLAGERMAVLGLMKTVEFYQGNPKQVEVSRLDHPAASDLELEKDTCAIFQVADDLYMHQRYCAGESAAATRNESATSEKAAPGSMLR
jgi:phosphoglycerol transferase MdoB-like AlkP superfamily enzyme